jgi:hypothetical protein
MSTRGHRTIHRLNNCPNITWMARLGEPSQQITKLMTNNWLIGGGGLTGGRLLTQRASPSF